MASAQRPVALLCLCALAGIAAGCGRDCPAGAPCDAPEEPRACGLPACADGELLGTSPERPLRCLAAPAAPAAFPPCADHQALTSDGGTLRCSEKDPGPADPLLEGALGQLLADLADLEQRTRRLAGRIPRFVGLTAYRSLGRISAPGHPDGLAAAAARCAAEHPGTHLCTPAALFHSVAAGRLGAAERIGKAWIYAPGWNHLPGAQNAQEGLGDSCAGYTYGRDDRGWAGVAMEWATLPTGVVGLKLHSGSGAPCSATLPLACCL